MCARVVLGKKTKAWCEVISWLGSEKGLLEVGIGGGNKWGSILEDS